MGNYKGFPDTFCPRFWNAAVLHSDSRIAPCCAFGGHIRDEYGADVKVSDQPIDDILTNNADYEAMRATSASGGEINACQWSCYRSEASGGRSQRKYALDGLMHKNPGVSAEKLFNSVVSSRPALRRLHLMAGNLCNYKCRMCGPHNSSSIAGDPVQTALLEKDRKSVRPVPASKGSDWHNNIELFKKNVLPSLENVEYLNITGGEPLMHPLVLELLNEMFDERQAQKCWLFITTNGSVFNENVARALRKFGRCQISISLDGVEGLNDYIRHGARWNTILENKRKFEETGAKVLFCTSIQVYNIFEIGRLNDFYHAGGHQFHFNWVHSPSMLDPCNLPSFLKQKCINTLKKYEKQASASGKSVEIVEYARKRLMNTKRTVAHYNAFKRLCEYTKALDVSRNEDLASASPGLFAAARRNSLFQKIYLQSKL